MKLNNVYTEGCGVRAGEFMACALLIGLFCIYSVFFVKCLKLWLLIAIGTIFACLIVNVV